MLARRLCRIVSIVLLSVLVASTAWAQYKITGDNGDMALDATLRLLMTEQEAWEGVDPAKTDRDRLFVESARFGLRGTYLEDIAWRMEWELRAHDQTGNGVVAKDLWLAWSPRPGLGLKAGQMKVPFSRKLMVSRKTVDSIDLPIAASGFVPKRDIGLLGTLRSADKRWSLAAGVFQGAGDNESADDVKGSKMLAARAEAAPWGPLPNSEGDWERSPEPLLLAGAGVVWSDDVDPAAVPAPDDESWTPPAVLRTIVGEKLLYGADLSFRCRGVFLNAEVSRARLTWDEDAVLAGRRHEATGLILQASYVFAGLNLEPRVMYDSFDPDDGAEDDVLKTVTWGLNWLPRGHRLKLMAEYVDRLEKVDGADRGWDEDEFRLLAQIYIH